ncbi:hypothetical protein ENUP19_0214G0011 [Entamoeba nuttalli]|uniref:Uncharacterized protein n=1 Tax=Entamoeba nuttalli TaxID=412467 RepID=A0ABQ0D8K8_9EUKA
MKTFLEFEFTDDTTTKAIKPSKNKDMIYRIEQKFHKKDETLKPTEKKPVLKMTISLNHSQKTKENEKTESKVKEKDSRGREVERKSSEGRGDNKRNSENKSPRRSKRSNSRSSRRHSHSQKTKEEDSKKKLSERNLSEDARTLKHKGDKLSSKERIDEALLCYCESLLCYGQLILRKEMTRISINELLEFVMREAEKNQRSEIARGVSNILAQLYFSLFSHDHASALQFLQEKVPVGDEMVPKLLRQLDELKKLNR